MAQGETLKALLADEKKLLKHYASLSKRLNRIVLLLGILQCVCLVVFAAMLSLLVDSAVYSQDELWQSPMVWLVLVGAVLVRAFASSAKEYFAHLASIETRSALRRDVLALVEQDGHQLVGRNLSIDLTNALNREVDSLKPYFANYLPQKQLAVITPVIILIASLSINWVVPLIYLATIPFIPLFMVMVGKKAAAASKENLDVLSRLGNLLSNRLQGISTLKAYGVIDKETEALHQQSDSFRKSTMKVLRLAFLSGTLLEFFSAISVALVAVYLGMLFLGKYELGMWQAEYGLFSGMFLLMLAPEFYLPMRRLGAFYHAAGDAKGVAKHLAEIFLPVLLPVTRIPETNSVDTTKSDVSNDGAVVEAVDSVIDSTQAQAPFISVASAPPVNTALGSNSFSIHQLKVGYGRRLVIEPVSFSLKAGEALLLSAPSGVGKSTLLDTLAGLKGKLGGDIRFSGRDIFEPSTHWHQHVGYMPQHPELLFDTVRNNLCLGKDYPDTELWEALKQAQLDSDIAAIPQQLDFIVSDQGGYISGGQAQRLALARVFLHQPKVLLLDEVTANLDADTEAMLFDALESYLDQGGIVVFASHREGRANFFTQTLNLMPAKSVGTLDNVAPLETSTEAKDV